MHRSIRPALLLSVVLFGTSPAWATDDAGGLPCNSLCKRWMSWGAPDPDQGPPVPPAPIRTEGVEPAVAPPAPAATPSALHPVIAAPRAATAASRAVAVVVPPRRPRDIALQVPVPPPSKPAPRKVVALAPALPVAAPARAASTIVIPVPDVPAPPSIPQVTLPEVKSADATVAGATQPIVADVSPVAVASAPAFLPPVAPLPVAEPVPVAPPVVEVPAPKVVPQRAVASGWTSTSVLPPFDVIGALILSTPPRAAVAGAKDLVSPQL